MCAPLDGRPGGLFPLGRRKQMSVSVDGSRVWIPAHIHFTTPCSKCQYVVQQFKHFFVWVIYERAFCTPDPYPTAEGHRITPPEYLQIIAGIAQPDQQHESGWPEGADTPLMQQGEPAKRASPTNTCPEGGSALTPLLPQGGRTARPTSGRPPKGILRRHGNRMCDSFRYDRPELVRPQRGICTRSTTNPRKNERKRTPAMNGPEGRRFMATAIKPKKRPGRTQTIEAG